MAVVSRPAPRTASRASSGKIAREVVRRVILFGGLAIFTVWTLFPLLWIVTTSFKTDKELYQQATIWSRTWSPGSTSTRSSTRRAS